MDGWDPKGLIKADLLTTEYNDSLKEPVTMEMLDVRERLSHSKPGVAGTSIPAAVSTVRRHTACKKEALPKRPALHTPNSSCPPFLGQRYPCLRCPVSTRGTYSNMQMARSFACPLGFSGLDWSSGTLWHRWLSGPRWDTPPSRPWLAERHALGKCSEHLYLYRRGGH